MSENEKERRKKERKTQRRKKKEKEREREIIRFKQLAPPLHFLRWKDFLLKSFFSGQATTGICLLLLGLLEIWKDFFFAFHDVSYKLGKEKNIRIHQLSNVVVL